MSFQNLCSEQYAERGKIVAQWRKKQKKLPKDQRQKKVPEAKKEEVRKSQHVIRRQFLCDSWLIFREKQQDERDAHDLKNSKSIDDSENKVVFGESREAKLFARESRSQLSTVHIRAQQRKGRKAITSVQGLAIDLDLNHVVDGIKCDLHINGSVQKDENFGEVIQFSGDTRIQIRDWLVKHNICAKEVIKIH